MQVNLIYNCTEWLSLDQLRQLLLKGELQVATAAGTLRLFVNCNDRVQARELGGD
jgi:hypothetical protein